MDVIDLAKYVKNKKNEDFVVKIFDGIPKRVDVVQPMKSDDLIKVHSFGRLCPREEAICSKLNIVREREIDQKLLFTFNMGSCLGDMIRDDWLGPAHYLIGSWKCKQCSDTVGKAAHEGASRVFMPDCCKCGSEKFTYIEETVSNSRYGISGHPDSFLIFNEKYYIGEIKTARSIGYNKIRNKTHESVDSTYLLQLRIYLWLTGYNDGMFIFINKDASPSLKHDHYLTCIPVKHDQKIINERVIRWIEILRENIELQKIPKREICSKPTDRRAKDCGVANRCFYGRF